MNTEINISKVIEYCFKILKLNYLVATYFNYNIDSKKVLEKLNFKFYKDIIIETRYNTKEESTLMLLINRSLKWKWIIKKMLI